MRHGWVLLLVSGCGLSSAPAELGVVQAALELDPDNRVVNPSFEDGGGWTDYRCTHVSEPSPLAIHGARVARVTMTSASGQYDLDDTPFVARDVDAGVTFVASAWVLGANPAAQGGIGFVALRERNAQGSNLGVREGRVTLDGGFNRVEVRLTTSASGSTVDVYVGQLDGVSGAELLVDLVQAKLDVDAGEADAGMADAGVADAGVADGGGLPPLAQPLVLNVACGCQASAGPMVGGLAWLWRRRRRG